MLHNVIDRAIQVHGAKGLTDDTPLSLMYRHAREARIYDGPDEVHIQSVAKEFSKITKIMVLAGILENATLPCKTN